MRQERRGATETAMTNCGSVKALSNSLAASGSRIKYRLVTDSHKQSASAIRSTIAADTSSASVSWVAEFGTSGDDVGSGVTSDPNGNTTMVGTTTGALPGYTNAGGIDVILAKYASNGKQIWGTQVGTGGDDRGYGITSDAAGSTTLVGISTGALPGYSNAGGTDIVVAKYLP